MTEHLLEYLRHNASRRGLVLAREVRLVDEFGATREDLDAALMKLESNGAIRVLSPLPYLVIALTPRSWSGRQSKRSSDEQQASSNQRSFHEEVPVSSSIAAAAKQPRVVGGAGEGEALLEEVLAALGPDADRKEFAYILAGRSPSLVIRCLRRVQATKTIRVSRAALFRSLLQKLSH